MRIRAEQEEPVAIIRGIEDWLEKYEYLIGLGDRLTPMDPVLKGEENAINGCQSRVWVAAELIDGRIRFQGDCEARITRGVLALILSIVDGRAPAEVAENDLDCLREIGLMEQLSPSRAGGAAAIVHRVRELATSLRLS